MAEDPTLQEHEDALASEEKDRAVAVLGLPELIAGIQVEPLTPRRLEWLRAMRSPFICGGVASKGAIAQFLWMVSKAFVFRKLERRKARKWLPFSRTHLVDVTEELRDKFIAIVPLMDAQELTEGIDAYIDRAFLDAPTGAKSGPSFYSDTVGLYHAIKESYPGDEWTFERVVDAPLRLLYQLIKCADKARGCSVVNRRSYAVQGKWLSQLETLTAETEDEVVERMNAKREDGYKQVTLAQRSADGTWSLAMRKGGYPIGQ